MPRSAGEPPARRLPGAVRRCLCPPPAGQPPHSPTACAPGAACRANSSAMPTLQPGGPFEQISCGMWHTCGVTAGREAFCFGSNWRCGARQGWLPHACAGIGCCTPRMARHPLPPYPTTTGASWATAPPPLGAPLCQWAAATHSPASQQVTTAHDSRAASLRGCRRRRPPPPTCRQRFVSAPAPGAQAGLPPLRSSPTAGPLRGGAMRWESWARVPAGSPCPRRWPPVTSSLKSKGAASC